MANGRKSAVDPRNGLCAYHLFWIAPASAFLTLFFQTLFFSTPLPQEKSTCALVLGASVNPSGPNPVFRGRLDALFELSDRDSLKVIISGGSIAEQNKSDALIAKEYLSSKGWPQESIFLEEMASNTKENLLFSQDLIRQLKCENTLVISDAIHLKRALFQAKRLGMDLQPYATPKSRFQSFSKRFTFALSESWQSLGVWGQVLIGIF